MREYEERNEIEKFYENARKNIKSKIEALGVSCKGAAKGAALSEIISVMDDALEIGIAEELVSARKNIHAYCRKYNEILSLERKIRENEEKLKAQQAVAEMVSLLTDDVLKNAIVAYNSLYEGRMNRGDAKEIAIAYINSKGRQDLEQVFDLKGEHG